MNADVNDLKHRVDSLTSRVRQIEDLLGVRSAEAVSDPATSMPEPSPVAAARAASESESRVAPGVRSGPEPESEAPPPPAPEPVPAPQAASQPEPTAEPAPTPKPAAEPPPIPAWAARQTPAPPPTRSPQSLAGSLIGLSRRGDRREPGEQPAQPRPAGIASLEEAASATATVSNGADDDADAAPIVPASRPSGTAVSAAGHAGSRIPVTPRDLERLIGGRWFAVIGALAVVIGIGLFLKLGYDRGWFNMAPWAKCIATALFGFALLGVGEWIRRWVNNLAAAGIFSAGLGTIFASVYAAYRLYDLLPDTGAFALMAATALLGVFVAARTRLVFVAVLSLAAGYLTPFVLTNAPHRPFVLPAYLLMLLAIGLVLCARLGRSFAPVRALVWWATLILGGFWELGTGIRLGGYGALFATLVWVAMHAELVFSSGRWGLQRDEGETPKDSTRPQLRRWSPLVASFSTTAWAVTFGALSLDNTPAPSWMAPAAGLAATILLAITLAGRLRGPIDKPSTDAERLGVALWVQAAGLLFATLALAFAGWAEVACWIALGLSSIAAARWQRIRAFDIYGLGVLAFVVVRLAVYDSWAGGLTAGAVPFNGFMLSSWTLLMAITGGAWLAASLAIVPRGEETAGRFAAAWRRTADFAACIGLTVLGGSLFHADISRETLLGLALGTAAAAGVWARLRRSNAVGVYGIFLLGCATLTSGMLHLASWTTPHADMGPGLSWRAASGLLLSCAALWGVLSAVARRWPAPADGDAAAHLRSRTELSNSAACIAVTLVPLAFVHPRMDAAAASVLCSATGLLLALMGRWLRSPGTIGFSPLLVIAGAGLAAASLWWAAPNPTLFIGLALTRTAAAPIVCGAALFVLGVLWAGTRSAEGPPGALSPVAPWAAASGVLAIGLGLCHQDASSHALVLIPLLLGVVCHATRRTLPALRLDVIGAAGIAIAGVVWVFVYAQRGWAATCGTWPLHPGLITVALMIVAWEWTARSATKDSFLPPTPRRAIQTILLFVASSLEVARISGVAASDPAVKDAAVSIWWGLFGFALIGLGFRLRAALARRAGLVLLAVAALKGLLLDLAGAPAAWRVASFIGLGLLMLAVAVVYQKIAAREDAADNP